MTPPPRRPQPPLIDAGYLIEPEPVDPRLPQHPPPDPGSARWVAHQPGYMRPEYSAELGCWPLITLLLAAILAILIAAPRSGQTTIPVDVSRDSSAALSGAPSLGSQSVGLPTSTDQPDGAPQAAAVLGGYATWYRDASQPADGLYAAAGPALRDALGDWRGREVRVQAGRRWTSVTLRDACWCVDRHGRPTLLDISPAAIAQLEPDYRRLGVVEVRVAWPVGELPATDANGGTR